MGENRTKLRARGLDRAFAILDHLRDCKQPLKPNEIAVGTGAPKSSVYEIIGSLIEQNVLEYTDNQGRVYLGRRLHFWGTAYLNNFSIAKEAQPFLEEITQYTSETSQLCMLDGEKYTVVLMKEGIRQFRISSDVGERIPIPWTASGRLLTSHLTDPEILSLIPPEDFTMPDGSQFDPPQFIAESRKAQEAGFFSFDSLVDNFTHCFAAPVFDENNHCVATLCMIAPREDASKFYDRYRQKLVESAFDLSAKLSGNNVAKLTRTGGV